MPRHSTRSLILIAAGSTLAGLIGVQTFAMTGSPERPIAAARNTGPARSCIPLSAFSETRVRSDRVIDFLSIGGKGWRNVLPQGCSGLAAANAFTYKTSLSELCDTDIVYPLEQVGGGLQRGPGCGLGRFQPIQLVK